MYSQLDFAISVYSYTLLATNRAFALIAENED